MGLQLQWFMNTLRRDFSCRDQYRQLEQYLSQAPPEVLQEIDVLRHKLEDKVQESAHARRRALGR